MAEQRRPTRTSICLPSIGRCAALSPHTARLRRWLQRRRSQRRERESRVLGERLAILAAAAALREFSRTRIRREHIVATYYGELRHRYAAKDAGLTASFAQLSRASALISYYSQDASVRS